MRILELTKELEAHVEGNLNTIVTGISQNSKEIEPGFLFVAIKGERFDGHNFVREALKSGACGFVSEKPIDVGAKVKIIVKNTKSALKSLLKRFYGDLTAGIKLVGITGTKGKTTTTHILGEILKAAGLKTEIISSIGRRLTTPPVDSTLRLISSRKPEVLVMETTSIGIEKGRIDGLRFDCAAFLNLSRDHLDIHKDMESYFKAKSKLFLEHLQRSGKKSFAVVNIDDKYGRRLAEMLTVIKVSRKKADCYPISFEANISGIKGEIMCLGRRIPFNSPLIGDFNILNIMVASCIALRLGVEPEAIQEGIRRTKIKGRMERIGRVFVDYAHTPESLKQALSFLRKLGKVYVVFGCGGDRDKGKRSLMGEVACKLADSVIVTSDNPRSEDPQKIIEDIMVGTQGFENKVKVILDREEAIRTAIYETKADSSLVLVAGKGHEDYQIIGDKIIPFSDVECVKKIIGYES